MEDKEELNNKGAITVLASDVPSDYHVVSPKTTDNPPPQAPPPPPPGSTPAPPQYGVALPPGVAVTTSTTIKKKRGRPRKYGLDGSVTAKALSPKPISSLALPSPPVIDFSAAKRAKIRPPSSAGKHHQPVIELGSLGNGNGNGDWVSCSVGASFTPHIITVNAGEDVTMKVISFSQQGPRAICILSANGVISSVTLRQSDSSGGTLTYEGRFEILSLTGSFMPSENGGMRNRSGGMSVSLASPDGRVMGGGVAGLLVAASPVQIVVGSFLAGNHLESKNQKPEHVTVSPASNVPFTISRTVEADNKPYHSTSSFHGENWSSQPSNTMNKPADINIALSG